MQQIRDLFKIAVKDRPLLSALILLWVLAVAYVVVSLATLTVSEHQIVTHYSIFGESHFYRSRWWYLLSFALAGLIAALVHTMLAVKVLHQEARRLAIAVVYSGSIVVLVLGVMMLRVYGVAVLS